MVDNLSKEKRSKVMTSIRGKNTKPELMIRKMLWSRGVRYRIHDRTVFGSPDVSIKKKKLAIFIDGCFWHGCSTCFKEPKTNVGFWRSKIENNKNRRMIVKKELRKQKWKVVEIWEHDIKNKPDFALGQIMRVD